MNITHMHEQLRIEMLRRIQRGTLSISLLSRQTGLGVSHVSNFLHARRRLSMDGMDRVLAAQHMDAEDLLERGTGGVANNGIGPIPVISHASALFEPTIRPSAVQTTLHLPPGVLQGVKPRGGSPRRFWQRFVAIRVARSDALPMDPLLLPDALAVIDRHYISLISYRASRPNLYAVRDGAHLTLRYADYAAMRLVLRPLGQAFPVNLIEIGPDISPGDLIAGRVILIINEL
ncbi:MAG TPA: hypothetical protein VGI45_16395 [Terracidiphilus sp.]